MTGSTPYFEKPPKKAIEKVSSSVSAAPWIIISIWSKRAVCVLLGGIFLWSGVTKLIDLNSFVVIIEAYGLIPENWTMAVAVALSLLEIIAGIGLLLDIPGAEAMTAALLVLFIAVLGYAVWMGLDIDCGCFGPGDPEAEAYTGLRPALYRDLVLLAGVFYLYFFRYYRTRVANRRSGGLKAAGNKGFEHLF